MGSPVPQDPYKALGVSKDATLANIRSVYRKLVLTCHPDKFLDETVKAQKADEFHKVQQAYELLSDEQKRTRYDEKVKLAELRAEVMRESGNARKAAGVYDHSPRTPRTGYWEPPRREPVVEIRPKPRYYSEEPPLRAHPSPRYEDHDHRSSSRRYEDMYDIPPASTSSKKASGHTYKDEAREQDSKSRTQRKWKETIAKATAEKARIYDDRRKSRDKDRRQDYQQKRYYARVESEEDTDSEVDSFMTPRKSTEPRRRYEPIRKSKRDEESRRKRTDDSDSSEEPDHNISHKVASAAEYILKSRVKSPAERDDRQRPAVTRSTSSRAAPPPTAPPPPPMPTVDSPKRSSARRGAVSSNKNSLKERKMPEIVEAAPQSSRRGSHDQTPRNRPNLPTAATSPLSSKSQPSPHHPPRAQTLDVHSSEKQPSMRRAQTSPLNTMISPSHAPLKSSKLRETHDSGYSSPGTPDAPVPPKASYKYRVAPEPDSDDSDVSRPTIVPIEPETRRRGERDTSPRTQSHRYDRSSGQSHASARNMPIRATTFEDRSAPPSRPTAPTRAATSRNDRDHRPLFGEISSPERRGSAHDIRSPPSSGYKVKYSSPIYSEDDIVYGEYSSRRGRGRGDSGAKDPDADAYAYARGGRHQSPVLSGRNPSGRTEVSTY